MVLPILLHSTYATDDFYQQNMEGQYKERPAVERAEGGRRENPEQVATTLSVQVRERDAEEVAATTATTAAATTAAGAI